MCSNAALPVRGEVRAAYAGLLEPLLRDHEGGWWADYVRLRVTATRG